MKLFAILALLTFAAATAGLASGPTIPPDDEGECTHMCDGLLG